MSKFILISLLVALLEFLTGTLSFDMDTTNHSENTSVVTKGDDEKGDDEDYDNEVKTSKNNHQLFIK